MGDDKPLRVSVAAQYLGVHRNTVRRWIEEGRLPFVEVGPRKRKRVLESVIREMRREISHVRA
jgi:excisionase family DNA binding protein